MFHFVGAGVFGFVHTLPQINYYTHGSQVTVSHGHLAFFGAYALLNLIVFYFAMPKLKGIARIRRPAGTIGASGRCASPWCSWGSSSAWRACCRATSSGSSTSAT